MEHLVATMLVWVSFLTGYSIPDTTPTVILEPHSFFVQKLCNNVETDTDPCLYVGLYEFSSKTIYMDETLSKQMFDAILVHELTHFMQGEHHKLYNSCANKIASEDEAYATEQRYITEAQHLDKKIYQPSDDEICRVDR